MSDVAIAESVKPVKAPEQPRTISVRDFKLCEYEYARFSARLAENVSFEDTLKPEFWVHVAHILQKTPVTNEPDKAGAIIELRTIDHSFYAELYVRAVQEKGLIVSTLREPVYFGPKAVSSETFDVKWNVGKRAYDIVRKSDREIVKGGVPTKEAAQDWIDKTVRAH